MARIEREFHTEMRGVDVRTNERCYLCFVGKWPDGEGKFLVIPERSICVKHIKSDDIQYNSEEIFAALIKANSANPLSLRTYMKIAREIAKAIEPYLKGGEKND